MDEVLTNVALPNATYAQQGDTTYDRIYVREVRETHELSNETLDSGVYHLSLSVSLSVSPYIYIYVYT